MERPEEPRETDQPDGILTRDRRPYRRPELTEYGSVAKLTQGGTIAGGDAMAMMMMP